jgi:hypothetical protein
MPRRTAAHADHDRHDQQTSWRASGPTAGTQSLGLGRVADQVPEDGDEFGGRSILKEHQSQDDADRARQHADGHRRQSPVSPRGAP